MGPLPALACGRVLARREQGVGVSLSPPTHILNITLTLGAYLGQGELHEGSLRRSPGAGCVSVLSKGVHTQQLFSPPAPRAGNVALPTTLALAEDPRHGKP